jgi:hypothetical protein
MEEREEKREGKHVQEQKKFVREKRKPYINTE